MSPVLEKREMEQKFEVDQVVYHKLNERKMLVIAISGHPSKEVLYDCRYADDGGRFHTALFHEFELKAKKE